MTTTIAFETSKGELSVALALGIILLTLALIINAFVTLLKAFAVRNAYA
jgi:tungstate transport system permease protein